MRSSGPPTGTGELVAASLPAAADHATLQHNRDEETLRRRLAEVNDSMDNLIHTLERTRNPGSQFAARTEARESQDSTRKRPSAQPTCGSTKPRRPPRRPTTSAT
jgi:hypothetical protein